MFVQFHYEELEPDDSYYIPDFGFFTDDGCFISDDEYYDGCSDDGALYLAALSHCWPYERSLEPLEPSHSSWAPRRAPFPLARAFSEGNAAASRSSNRAARSAYKTRVVGSLCLFAVLQAGATVSTA